MEYLALDEAGEPLVSGETVLVMYDYETGKTKGIPPEVREAMEGHEEGGLVG